MSGQKVGNGAWWIKGYFRDVPLLSSKYVVCGKPLWYEGGSPLLVFQQMAYFNGFRLSHLTLPFKIFGPFTWSDTCWFSLRGLYGFVLDTETCQSRGKRKSIWINSSGSCYWIADFRANSSNLKHTDTIPGELCLLQKHFQQYLNKKTAIYLL